ncbi:MAG TPA: DUF3817 domain-containing protein [Cryomorphaceae bacterium]|nr:hypothetical protein [Owenweeksia sp.]MBF98541.1 hypothetical protein [Owenweeksia sp.]HAD96105.1 DUF3817 domain-containing protein [Cryomorphaceae bacterium]HBF18497.1 DUF3817 domain-containing protein [Cryomorphaceae bacterium]HCQ16985.1 DUF3817 domain-containing protein [Cryomorphaceae bacterium]|tara:strand:+ start:106 stop:429 length:324 start_codon:yes stop_codon:yes gene_type:complete
MLQLLKTNIGRLRIIAFLEGLSLILLVFVAVPLKYMLGNPIGSEVLGPIHGALFLLFIINTISVAIEYDWGFSNRTTWMVLISSFIPFGTFYMDRTVLSKVERPERN